MWPHNVITIGWDSAGWETRTLKAARASCAAAATPGRAEVEKTSRFMWWTVQRMKTARRRCDKICVSGFMCFGSMLLEAELIGWSVWSVGRISIRSCFSRPSLQINFYLSAAAVENLHVLVRNNVNVCLGSVFGLLTYVRRYSWVYRPTSQQVLFTRPYCGRVFLYGQLGHDRYTKACLSIDSLLGWDRVFNQRGGLGGVDRKDGNSSKHTLDGIYQMNASQRFV